MKKKLQKNIGRKLGNMHYIHRSAIDYLPPEETEALILASSIVNASIDWNLVKISKKLDTVSFLLYDNFDDVLFPVLLKATVVNIVLHSLKTIDYRKRKNPPVLHRKELMLAPDDPRISSFAETTIFCEDRQLFKNASYIGTKLKWEERLRENGFKIEGLKIVPLLS